MKCSFRPVIAAFFAVLVLSSPTLSFAQNEEGVLKEADELMANVIDLNDPVLSIWPTVNDVEVESLSAAVLRLTEAYEADRLDADERTRELQAMVSDTETDEETIKDLIKVAKDEDNDDERDRLEDLKDVYELRRKYLERITKVREGERQLAETRIDYVNQLSDVLVLAQQLVNARESGDVDEMLGTERELIRQSGELGQRLDKVAGNLKRVNNERERAFRDREKLIAAYY